MMSHFSASCTLDVRGLRLTTVSYQSRSYLIGVQIARHFLRETYNLYRSMKLRGLDMIKCTPEQIEELQKLGAIQPGVHSATLIALEPGLDFIERMFVQKRRVMKPSGMKRRQTIWDHLLDVAAEEYSVVKG